MNTPEFVKWFGKSVVVDASGKPMSVFHATKHPATGFDPKYKTELSSHGFHFGTADQANFRTTQYDFNSAKTAIGKYFLSIQHPLEVSHMASFAPDHLAEQMMEMGLIDEVKFGKIRDRFSSEADVGRELVKILKKAGYDGLKYANDREGKGFSYVPFDASQIKSATGNRGTFDPTSTHIGEAEISRRADIIIDNLLSEQYEFPYWFTGNDHAEYAKQLVRRRLCTELREFLASVAPNDPVGVRQAVEAAANYALHLYDNRRRRTGGVLSKLNQERFEKTRDFLLKIADIEIDSLLSDTTKS